MLFEILFDHLGNARLGDEKYFSNSITGDRNALEETVRRFLLALANSIHAKLDTISCKA
jgi:hypothetical protein